MARWEEALDAKLDLYLFAQSERGQRYIDGWQHAEVDGHHLNVDPTDRMVDRVAAVAFLADPVWVDPDMQTLWEAAVPSFEPETLHDQDLITNGGFCYLPRPHFTTDVHGRRTSFRAFAWATTMLDWKASDATVEANFPGVLLFMFHQVGDADDYDNGNGLSIGYDDDTPKFIPYAGGALRRGDLLVDFVYPWPFNSKVEDGSRRLPLKRLPNSRDQYEVVSEDESDRNIEGVVESFGRRVQVVGPDNIEKHVQCLWRLMQQTIATRTQIEPTRHVRKRAVKARVDPRKITVIQLRRPNSAPSGEHRSVEWSHRWLVAGHWRRQWYSSLNEHRQIWISPYVKGPDDAPLELRKERVFELVR